MLNYIWAGLIVFSLVFAITNDVLDISSDRYRILNMVTLVKRAKPVAADLTVMDE